MSAKISSPLETERLWLVPWSADDLAAARPIFTDPEVMRYINGGFPLVNNEIHSFIERQQHHFALRGFCLWKLLRKADARFIGFCGLQPIELDCKQEIEIGWRLMRDQWGLGLATEAAHAALHDAVERKHLGRVIAIAMPENRTSLRVMEKLGMTYERATQKAGFNVAVYARHFDRDGVTGERDG